MNLKINGKTRRKTLEHADQTLAMRLAGGHKTKHSFGRLLYKATAKTQRNPKIYPQNLEKRTISVEFQKLRAGVSPVALDFAKGSPINFRRVNSS